jgi:putative methyltransferase (TIGR04325 family)
MNANLKSFIKSCVPPILHPRRDSLEGRVRFEGNYAGWAEAEKNSSGYDAPAILEKVKSAVQQVVDGKAAYERDSVVFHAIEYEMPLLACLLYVLNETGRRQLTVADFGGSLGSTYFQHRSAFPPSLKLRWAVVELPHFVKCGRENFSNDSLTFYEDLDECEKNESPDVILLSGVLQYLPDPYGMLESVSKRRARYLLLDKTPIYDCPDRLTIQHVPQNIYSASYPAWFLNSAHVKTALAGAFRPLIDFKTEYAYPLEGGEVPLRGTLQARNA